MKIMTIVPSALAFVIHLCAHNVTGSNLNPCKLTKQLRGDGKNHDTLTPYKILRVLQEKQVCDFHTG